MHANIAVVSCQGLLPMFYGQRVHKSRGLKQLNDGFCMDLRSLDWWISAGCWNFCQWTSQSTTSWHGKLHKGGTWPKWAVGRFLDARPLAFLGRRLFALAVVPEIVKQEMICNIHHQCVFFSLKWVHHCSRSCHGTKHQTYPIPMMSCLTMRTGEKTVSIDWAVTEVPWVIALKVHDFRLSEDLEAAKWHALNIWLCILFRHECFRLWTCCKLQHVCFQTAQVRLKAKSSCVLAALVVSLTTSTGRVTESRKSVGSLGALFEPRLVEMEPRDVRRPGSAIHRGR